MFNSKSLIQFSTFFFHCEAIFITIKHNEILITAMQCKKKQQQKNRIV